MVPNDIDLYRSIMSPSYFKMGLKYYAKPGIGYRLIRLFTIMFSRSLSVKNIRSKVLYLLHVGAKQ